MAADLQGGIASSVRPTTVPQHIPIDPAILYFGTPVALLSTVDNAGHPNLAPISSVFWLEHTAVLGVGTRSQTARNLLSTEEIVVNLPSADLVTAVNQLALTTGRDPVPRVKHDAGTGTNRTSSGPPDCGPFHRTWFLRPGWRNAPSRWRGDSSAHVPWRAGLSPKTASPASSRSRVLRVHVHPTISTVGHPDRVDPVAWRPLVMSFQRFFGLGGELHPSRLSTIDEEWYR